MDLDLGASDPDAWRAVNARLSVVPGPAKRPPWWRRHLRWLVLALVADVVLGTLLFRWLRDEQSTPERAVQEVVARVHDRDWRGLRDGLCAPDKARYGEAELAQAGLAALVVLRGVDGFEVDRVVTVPDLTLLGPVALPARRVDAALAREELTPEQLREMAIFLSHYVGWPRGAAFNNLVEQRIAQHAGAGSQQQFPGPKA